MIEIIKNNLIIATVQAQERLPSVLAIPSGTGVTQQGTVFTFVASIVRWSLGLIGIILFVIILVSGFKYATAGDDPKKTQDAMKSIINAVIGLFIVGLAFVLSNTVLGFVFNIGS